MSYGVRQVIPSLAHASGQCDTGPKRERGMVNYLLPLAYQPEKDPSMPAARPRNRNVRSAPPPPKPSSDVYTALLVISLLILVGCSLGVWYGIQQYPSLHAPDDEASQTALPSTIGTPPPVAAPAPAVPAAPAPAPAVPGPAPAAPAVPGPGPTPVPATAPPPRVP